MAESCPTCGAPLSDSAPIRYHPEAGIVIAGGAFVKMPRREMQIFELQWEGRGRWFSQARVFEEVYRRDDPPEDEQVIQSHVSKLRKRIARLGIVLRSERFRGYSINPRGD